MEECARRRVVQAHMAGRTGIIEFNDWYHFAIEIITRTWLPDLIWLPIKFLLPLILHLKSFGMNTSIASTKRTEREGPVKIGVHKQGNETIRKILLYSGAVSSLYYVAINIIVPMHFPGYNVVSQTVSELSAINAPTRPLWVLLATFYSLFVIAFGWGVLLSSGSNKILRIVAVLLLIYGVSGFFWPPMHLRGNEFSITDAMHIIFGIVSVVLMMLMVSFGAAAFGKRFRLYSIVTLVAFIAFGTMTGLEAPNIAANLPTPRIGIWERINIGVFMLWVIVFTVILLRRHIPNRSATRLLE